ncbi:MAG: 50S ribosomal protein L21 [Pseudomonadota bacterium]|nr:50S ribosomal protein L21 [Gammaproteobacteria bacterium]MBU1558497.1 50S ribosomal protein L21 [Gammaproteobacteria bacterium]MBU1629237.1 50S ribosomal protein L21 [Gammaproteobacteria bacterium]MBU1927332.1 50S ribosomal protein L21 [Gammaproteobacteria bacterium]MBU2546436.1 50S ribosomal protein L21 [Gammaproteobacteria bacterium]
MYAVIIAGGKQHKVQDGEELKIEKLDLAEGDGVAFDQVLLVADGDKVTLGTPYIEGAKVTATVLEQGRHKKVQIIKFKRRKHSMKHQGHRQYFTKIKITGIQG